MAKSKSNRLKTKKLIKLNLLETFLVSTFLGEIVLIFIMPQITHSQSFDGSFLHRVSFICSLNPAIQTLWTAEIVGLLVTGIYAISQRRIHKLGTVYSPNVAALMGIYGLYFGFYYTVPARFDILRQTALPQLLIANLWLVGGLFAGWLLGKGMECSGKPGFWIRPKSS